MLTLYCFIVSIYFCAWKLCGWIFAEHELHHNSYGNADSFLHESIIVFSMIHVLLGYFNGYLCGLNVIKQVEIDYHVLLLIGIVIEIWQLWIYEDFESTFQIFH